MHFQTTQTKELNIRKYFKGSRFMFSRWSICVMVACRLLKYSYSGIMGQCLRSKNTFFRAE